MRTPRITARAAALAVLLGLGAGLAWADSIWDRRIPNGGYLFVDNRARKVGDLLTVLITETTNIQHFEQRNSDKTTKNHWLFSWAGKMTGNVASRISQANADLDNESERMLQGRSQYMANRAFVDHMTVTVVQVL
ncbi:MAG TPA: flagellar basal body L-ring protein FlgH, partial [Gemmataceae bacterium]|nr:flagellar basal body L-ring protein FlgH [Gemmataceae bacterium]